ncbi:hypothetical protein IW150_000012 [Coemansia sp. RSA 2607]|nr:hypothetical protein IW150_000012 [Coemansia sp. RSA 2607]
MTPSETERTLSRSHIVSRAQRLQTVAAEASDQLRDQTVQLLQTQSIRLEDIAATEIESLDDMDQSLNELMQCILYTELRKDVRAVTDAIDDMQHRLYSSRQDMTSGQNGDNHDEEEVDVVDDDTTPTQISTAETFQTARGVPMFSESLREEHAAKDTDARPISSGEPPGSRRRQKLPLTFSPTGEEEEANNKANATSAATHPTDAQNNSSNQVPEGTREQLLSLEHRLYAVCIEIHEWRRTQCVREFVREIKDTLPTDVSRSPSVRSAKVPRERILGEAHEWQRARASSLGHQVRDTQGWSVKSPGAMSLRLGTSPPTSRLLQVEREVEVSRALSNRRSSATRPPEEHQSNRIHPSEPSDAPSKHFNTLRLLDTPTASTTTNDTTPRHRTLADDVRIIGWVTRGSGLDVHTEFKVVVHLAAGSNLTVMRRYTDFVELRAVLCEHYATFRKRIPELPAKRAFGKFDDRFLRKRESGLQFFLAYVMLHPVIGCSSVIRRWLGNP